MIRNSIPKLIVISAFVLASATAHAGWKGWGGGYFQCKKTPIEDVSNLTITEGAEALGLTTLVDVLPDEVAELLDTSKDITVFAPTNDAFDSLLGALGAPPEDVLTEILAYHVVPKKFDPRRVTYIRKVGTLGGQTLFVSRSAGGPDVNQSNIECQGYRTKNGLVWVIDSVLLPQF